MGQLEDIDDDCDTLIGKMKKRIKLKKVAVPKETRRISGQAKNQKKKTKKHE